MILNNVLNKKAKKEDILTIQAEMKKEGLKIPLIIKKKQANKPINIMGASLMKVV